MEFVFPFRRQNLAVIFLSNPFISVSYLSYFHQKKVVKQTDQRLGQKKAARERLAAIKAALKEKENKEKEKVLFDAGFFHVESPVKEKQVHCAGKTWR